METQGYVRFAHFTLGWNLGRAFSAGMHHTRKSHEMMPYLFSSITNTTHEHEAIGKT